MAKAAAQPQRSNGLSALGAPTARRFRGLTCIIQVAPAMVLFVALVHVNGIDLACERLGDPADPPVVLVAGLGAQLVSWRVGFCRLLVDRGYHVVRFDNRDVGLSTRFPDGGYTIADMAADVA